MSILTELQDPRVRDVTVTYVEISGDLRYAKIHVSIMGDDARQRTCVRGLESSAGFLQAKVADRLELRYTPKLSFELDQGVKRSIAVAQILREVLPPEPSAETDLPDEEPSDSAPSGVPDGSPPDVPGMPPATQEPLQDNSPQQ